MAAAAATSTTACGHVRARQRLSPPGGGRQRGRHRRPVDRRPLRARHRRGLEPDRLPGDRHPVRAGGCARQPSGRGARDHHAFFGGETVRFDGQHYQIEELEARPEPSRPRPPILIGANGPRMLRLAARYADIVNFPDRPLGRHQYRRATLGLGISVPEQMAVLREAAGARFARSRAERAVHPAPHGSSRASDRHVGRADAHHGRNGFRDASPHSPAPKRRSSNKLQYLHQEHGISYAVLPATAMDETGPAWCVGSPEGSAGGNAQSFRESSARARSRSPARCRRRWW